MKKVGKFVIEVNFQSAAGLGINLRLNKFNIFVINIIGKFLEL